MHVVIITREDPPLSISRYRVQRKITEIRVSDLRFNFEEILGFYNLLMNIDLSNTAASYLETRTEGWVAGLQLVSISIQGQDSDKIENFILSFSGSNRHIIDYLVDEVLRKQNNDICNFYSRRQSLRDLTPHCVMRLQEGVWNLITFVESKKSTHMEVI